VKDNRDLQFRSPLVASLATEKLLVGLHRGIGLKVTGPRIVFSRYDASTGTEQIYAVDPNDPTSETNISSPSPLAQYPHDECPSISSTGLIAFSRGSGGYTGAIFTMNIDGSRQTQITTPPVGLWDNQPAWSGDGKYIAFVRSYQIWIANANGTNAHPVVAYPTSPFALDHTPTWNPTDNTQIAFWREHGGISAIMTLKITPNSSTPTSTAPVNVSNPGKDDWDGWPSWSPDGAQIAFWRNRGGQAAIWILTLSTATATQLSKFAAPGDQDRTPCWSPSGSEIACARTSWVDWQIFILETNGSGVRSASQGGGAL